MAKCGSLFVLKSIKIGEFLNLIFEILTTLKKKDLLKKSPSI